MQIKQGNPKAFETILKGLKSLEGVQSKVGWFESAKYENGTPVAYAMAIQELGVASRSIPPRPYFRPTAIEKQNEWASTGAEVAKKVVAGHLSGEEAMGIVALKAEGDVLKTIDSITTPPLSPITLGARKYRMMGKKVTGATIGEIARLLKEGKLDLSGVPTKPLNDTGYARSTLTSVTEKI